MADGKELDDDWGPKIAKWTFRLTLIGAALFVFFVVAFVLSRQV